MKYVILCILVIATAFTGCKKSDDPTPSKLGDIPSNIGKWTDGYYDTPDVYHAFSISYYSNTAPTPLIIAFHGGGYVLGDKEDMKPEKLNELMEFPFLTEESLANQKIAYVTANYSLLTSSSDSTVSVPLNDCKKMLYYMRAHASQYNIDPDKIILLGVSAGASTSLWLGLQEQEGIKGIIAIDPQADLNLNNWREEIFVPASLEKLYDDNYNTIGESFSNTQELFYGTTDGDMIKQYSDIYHLDLLDMMDEYDPELYMLSKVFSPTDLIHHPCHLNALNKRAESTNYKATIVYVSDPYYVKPDAETAMDFCLRKFAGE